MMKTNELNLNKTVNVPLTLGHLYLAWHTLSSHFSNLREYDHLTEAERRALWGLEDALEHALAKQKIPPNLSETTLIKQTSKHMENIHIECLD